MRLKKNVNRKFRVSDYLVKNQINRNIEYFHSLAILYQEVCEESATDRHSWIAEIVVSVRVQDARRTQWIKHWPTCH